MYSNLVTLSEPSQQSIWCYTSKSARSIPTVRISMWPKAGRTWQVTAALGRTYTHSAVPPPPAFKSVASKSLSQLYMIYFQHSNFWLASKYLCDQVYQYSFHTSICIEVCKQCYLLSAIIYFIRIEEFLPYYFWANLDQDSQLILTLNIHTSSYVFETVEAGIRPQVRYRSYVYTPSNPIWPPNIPRGYLIPIWPTFGPNLLQHDLFDSLGLFNLD